MNFFISGIDTDCGKTAVTALISKYLLSIGYSVITQKPVQTGCENVADDIKFHRKTEGRNLIEDDINYLTCRYLFKYPASPHLSAMMENVTINPQLIFEDTKKLEQKYNVVLTEGAGGLYVPLIGDYYTLDYIKNYNLKLVLVASSKLGSINHALMSIEVCKNHGIDLHSVIYNYLPNSDNVISPESEKRIALFTKKLYPSAKFFVVPEIKSFEMQIVDFKNFI